MRRCRVAIYEEMTMTDQETYDRTLDAPSPASVAAEPVARRPESELSQQSVECRAAALDVTDRVKRHEGSRC